MPFVLSARNNVTYGGNLINQKYSPLQNIVLDVADRVDYQALFSNRQATLTGINAYPPNAINFYGNLPAVAPAVAPLVVVSSNRANWMQKILQNAVNHDAFTGYLDNATFNDDVVPWYAPLRSDRPVYIVVHWSEYDYYEERVGGDAFTNVTVVAYKFTAQHPALDIVGFGASRYAALQLMIHLGYRRAWAVDDNVINVNGFPNRLDDVEANMPLGGNIWGIGFSAATTNINQATLYDGVTVTFVANALNFADTNPGLLQQVVLWNLDLLSPAHLNYSPLFVSSNEDVSLSNYLQFNNFDERIITACKIIKYEPQNDPATNLGASVEIPKRRNRLLNLFNGIESDILINPGDGQVTLQEFISKTVLPGAHQPESAALVSQSRAIEQVLSAATKLGWYPANPLNPFNPYDGAAQINQLLPANI